MKLTIFIILLYIDVGSTRGDADDITEKPWSVLEELELEKLVSGNSNRIHSDTIGENHVTLTTKPDNEESTTLQYPSIAPTTSTTQESLGLEIFEKMLRASTGSSSPNRAGMTENQNPEQAGLKGNNNFGKNESIIEMPPKGNTLITQQGAQRPAKQNYYNKASLPSNQKPSFETTRGKNWCAYVHTRLLPTVGVDNVETYVSTGAEPCAWSTGGCAVRSRVISQPVYRMRHKIVTSLEWKCCPGYSGHNCQLTAPKVKEEIQDSQAESSLAENSVNTDDTKTDLALQKKLTDQIYNQDIKLALLQRKVENITSSMSDVHRTLHSLEGKIDGDYKGEDLQSLLKDLKSKSIADIIQGFVKDELAVFQREMQETIAKLFKSMSGMSVELEKTKETVKQLNETIIFNNHKCIIEEENKPTMDDIVDLKNRVEHLKNTAFVCTTSFKEQEKKIVTLEEQLEHEKLRNSLYFDTLNNTLSKMKEIHAELLADEQAEEQLPSTLNIPANDNITEYLYSLQDRVKKQNILMLQLYDDINVQDNKINNFTITLEIQRQSIERACEDRFSSCKDAFRKQLKGTEETVHTLNKTMSDVVLPLDTKIDKMNEQINDLCYDMETLQPLIEKGAPFNMNNEYGQQNDLREVKESIKNITDVLGYLSSTVHELMIGQAGLQSEAQRNELMFERRVNGCLIAVEDGLNNTMDIFNNAIDSIRDNYVHKSEISKFQQVSQMDNATTQKLEILLSTIPVIHQLNETLYSIISKSRNSQDFDDNAFFNRSSNIYVNMDISSSFANLSQKFNEALFRLDQCQLNISQMEEKLQVSGIDAQICRSRLQNIESQVNMILMNPTVLSKTTKDEGPSKDKAIKELYSRVKALELKSTLLLSSVPRMNKTVTETKVLCQTMFITVKKVNESVPQLVKAVQPNFTSLQKGFEELITSLIEVKMEAILSNVTTYTDNAMADLTSDTAKLQKQVKFLMKRLPPQTKEPPNSSTFLAGRNQRNSDVTEQDNDQSSCSSAPCYNGGTCINDRKTFVCACRHPFGGANCSLKLSDESSQSPDFSKGSYRYAPMVAFYVSHTYGMTAPGPIRFNNLYVNYGSSYAPTTGKFHIPYLGVYVFKYTIESFSPRVSGYFVVDGIDKIAFQSENMNNSMQSDRVVTGDVLLELNYGQVVWLRLATGSIPAQYPPVTTFSGYLLYRT
ncbi:multimerin-1 [Pelobates fuscus]|uniref:multimerin-1 n=1 Tax=Pelobates fuscus TaxID=191477 RepID=UPI002FE4C731